MHRKRPLLLLLLSFGLIFGVYGQDKKPGDEDEVIKVKTQLVETNTPNDKLAGKG